MKITTSKQIRGQYFTKTEDLLDVKLPFTKKDIVIEPFTGDQFISKWLVGKCKKIEEYDKFPTNKNIKKRDTLMNPPDYTGNFVVTNPPYSKKSRQSSDENEKVYEKYDTDDLYKAFIKSISGCAGGIFIVPFNFMTGIGTKDVQLRDTFFSTFKILQMKIFEKQMFPDTKVCVVVISFVRSPGLKKQSVDTSIIGKKTIRKNILFESRCKWIHGGCLYDLTGGVEIIRIYKPVKKSLVMQIIDSSKLLHLRIRKNEQHFDRNQKGFATLTIPGYEKHYSMICELFNKRIADYRKKYNNMFLSSFYENNRKFISLFLVYKILSDICKKLNKLLK